MDRLSNPASFVGTIEKVIIFFMNRIKIEQAPVSLGVEDSSNLVMIKT